MGALFSTPTATPHETSNLSIQRTSNPPDDMRSLPLASTSIPSPSSSNLNPPSSILSYFSPVPSPMITHTHISPSRTDVLKVRLTLQSLGVPLELIPGILDYARFWTGCRVLSRRRLEVASEWSRPDTARNVSGRDWATGQEDDVLEERERFLRNGGDFTEWGLRDRPGEAWYLISQPVGCFSADSSSIAGHGYSAESTTEQSMAGDPESRHSDDPGPAGSSDSQLVLDLSLKKRKKRRDWVREIVIETFSKDQGWSSGGQQHYGTYEASYSWFELSILRYGREVRRSRISIQNNVHAGQYMKSHRNILTRQHPFVQKIEEGDRIVLWARAMYPGWRNLVQEGAITVFTSNYAPDEH